MKLEWLETAAAVEKYGSFSEAAAMIPCSQSSVSRQVKSAEDELGITIFKRSSNSNTVELTPEGELLMPLLHKLLDDYGELLEQSRTMSARKQTPLTLGLGAQTFSSSSKGILMSTLYLSHPEILLTMEEIPVSSYIEQLLLGRVDAVLFTRAFRTGERERLYLNDASLRCVPLGRQNLSMAIGESRVPRGMQSIGFAALKDESFVFNTDILKLYDPADRSSRHGMFIEACLAAGFEPKLLKVERHLADIKQTMAVQGRGIFPSTIPTFLREYPGLRYVPVENAPYYVRFYLLSLGSNKNPAISELAVFLQECFDSSGGE